MSEVVEQIVTEEHKEKSTDQNTEQAEEEPKPKRGRGRPKKEKPPPPPKPQKIKKTEDMKAYMREYLKKYYVEKCWSIVVKLCVRIVKRILTHCML